MITEAEYLKALDVVREYTKQVNEKSNEFLINDILTKTPSELDYYTDNLDISARVWNILCAQFSDVRICDITKIKFMKARNGGQYGWKQFLDFKESLNTQKFKI
jgi:hypothetical protein